MEKLEENKGGSRYKGCTFFPVVVVFYRALQSSLLLAIYKYP